jgi:hypothetical protein
MAIHRPKTPRAVEEKVLTMSARRCALCYGLDGSLRECAGQIAHVDRDRANAKLANLAYLCLTHHDTYDAKTSQSKGLVPAELLHYRSELYEAIARKDHHRASRATGPQRAGPSNRALEHDRKVFRSFARALSEDMLEIVLEKLVVQRGTHQSHLDMIDAFLKYHVTESDRFLLPELQESLDQAAATFRTLRAFIGLHFMPVPVDDGIRTLFEPDLKARDHRRYYEFFAELQILAENARATYRTFRRTIKRALVV